MDNNLYFNFNYTTSINNLSLTCSPPLRACNQYIDNYNSSNQPPHCSQTFTSPTFNLCNVHYDSFSPPLKACNRHNYPTSRPKVPSRRS